MMRESDEYYCSTEGNIHGRTSYLTLARVVQMGCIRKSTLDIKKGKPMIAYHA
jgi:hypothetical protein